ncbi:sodium:solute symporter family protein [Sagittula sp. MA-2]|jgi:SSS family solute:Na+ symporter|uniref:sodium:solute symporter family protein n=1 Tax=Sagittula sp. MA-2 TaxID=3048007 RepID=UPI0024C22BDB|nr:sodium:solute symporter family protein [Sagittula sp. MA-2]WHZ37948.1 sodium:solute symporter family protein [Sagittula sp. MA-2]
MSQSFIWYGIGAYVVISVIVALLSRAGKSTTMSDYFLGGRSMGGVVSALSYSATTYSAFMMVGLAGLTYKGGVGALGFEIVYFAGVSLVAIFGPRFWAAGKKYGFVTPSEMLGARYGSRWVAIAAAVVSCVFLIPYSAVQLSGIGYLVSGMTEGGISFGTGLLIATVLAIFFSYVAGIRSVMWTDSLQALVMIVASALVAILVVSELGGFNAMFATVAERKPEMLTVPGPGLFSLQTFIGLTIPWFFFSISNPQVSQRLFMPESLGALRRMLLIFLCFGLIYTLVSVIWGFSAFVAFPDLASPDLATSVLLASDFVPPVLGVIVMVGILAAAVSTIDSILLTLSSMVARDVYGNVGGDQSDHRQLWVGKLVIPVISLLALGFAALELSLISILSVAASAGLVVTVPAIVGAFFWKRGTAAGALSSIAGGGLFVIVMYLTGNKLFGYNAGILGLPVSTLLFVGVSLVTRVSNEVTEGFVAKRASEPVRAAVNAG